MYCKYYCRLLYFITGGRPSCYDTATRVHVESIQKSCPTEKLKIYEIWVDHGDETNIVWSSGLGRYVTERRIRVGRASAL
jgi:hypothetical protein